MGEKWAKQLAHECVEIADALIAGLDKKILSMSIHEKFIMSMTTTVGYVSVGQEFSVTGKTFKRVNASSWYPSAYCRPSVVDGKPLQAHQNTIPVMCKEDGAFYNAECWLPCELIIQEVDL